MEEPEQFKLCVDSDVHPDIPKKYKKGADPWWFRWRYLQPPDPNFWKGDGLVKYRKQLLCQLLEAWTDLAPLMDNAAVAKAGLTKRT